MRALFGLVTGWVRMGSGICGQLAMDGGLKFRMGGGRIAGKGTPQDDGVLIPADGIIGMEGATGMATFEG